MCRNIRPLFNYDPPVTEAEIHEAALQFVRKVSGFRKPSAINQPVFDRAISEVSDTVLRMLADLSTDAAPRNRAEEAQKAKLRNAKRFATGR